MNIIKELVITSKKYKNARSLADNMERDDNGCLMDQDPLNHCIEYSGRMIELYSRLQILMLQFIIGMTLFIVLFRCLN